LGSVSSTRRGKSPEGAGGHAFHPESLVSHLEEKPMGLHLLENSRLKDFTRRKKDAFRLNAVSTGRGRRGGRREV